MSFDVFLSHNSRDKPAVRDMGEALKRRGLRVWLDEWELVPGRPWQEALEEIIETTRAAAVLVGKDGLGPWQEPEMRGCLAEFVNRKLPVIPVLLPGAPRKPELPLFLKQFRIPKGFYKGPSNSVISEEIVFYHDPVAMRCCCGVNGGVRWGFFIEPLRGSDLGCRPYPGRRFACPGL